MATYKKQRYLFMTLDPVHIGTGGYRLGRVDNSIVREPGTKIPKIPGTSLHGAARSYAAQLYGTPWAAGQSHEHPNEQNFDLAHNPVCYTFVYVKQSKDESGTNEAAMYSGYSGVVNIFDAHVLLFPVHSMVGPVWVSTAERLRDAGFTVGNLPDDRDRIDTAVENLPDDRDRIDTAVLNWKREDALNLGWLMLQVSGQTTVTAPTKWINDKRWQAIQKIVLVEDAIFSQVVNSNLEVRTSVAIDPETGAAKDGQLFTYEAIPRATFLTAELVLDDYRHAFTGITKTARDASLPGEDAWSDSLDVVKAGFRMIEWLGVGGMGTRGFGRMAIIGEPVTVALETLFSKEQNSG